ncbi:DNA primase [Litorivita sp. NS0012-18]|uniref:DNA primase n=1 Tax=Litorivita sp. NS0012-18 TaxID=3127655 RepID=UPI003105F493
MSLPPGFLDELRSRTSLSQVVGRKVMWDARKSNQGKGDMWAPCPFHQEKSASFHVDDRKGYYYCFGCHAKGDAISFVRETENVDFMEAVKILAQECGLPMPARDPQAQQKADRNAQLAEVMEMAVQYFRLQLRTGAAGPARDYLVRRGLDEAAQERFGIGFAPEGWQNLWDHLRAKNVPEELILGAGLAKASTKGKKPYDTFRNRIMFPIRDGRGRAIAFGGRAMDPNDNAKYLNSPETALFDKGRSLYNQGPAREAAGKGQALVVAEGYMDVIALSEAGFGAAVAPLGTAVTEHQLALLWRISPEPVIALDGDAAGLRAAMRVIDLALPLLEAGKSLRFAIMPEGKDPDDVIRSNGAAAMGELIDGAVPMVDLLWQRETEGKNFDSPERKAGLDKALREKIKLIRDPSIRKHYGEAIKELRWALFRPNRGQGGGAGAGSAKQGGGTWTPRRAGGAGRGKWQAPPQPPTQGAKASALVGADPKAQDHLRVGVILASLIATPQVVESFRRRIARMQCTGAEHGPLRDLVLRHAEAALLEAAQDEVHDEAAPQEGRLDGAREDAIEDAPPVVVPPAPQAQTPPQAQMPPPQDGFAPDYDAAFGPAPDAEGFADEGAPMEEMPFEAIPEDAYAMEAAMDHLAPEERGEEAAAERFAASFESYAGADVAASAAQGAGPQSGDVRGGDDGGGAHAGGAWLPPVLAAAPRNRAAEILCAKISQEIGRGALERLMAQPHVRICPPVRRPGDLERAEMTLAEELAKLEARRGLAAEVREAEEDFIHVEDETLTWRLAQAAEAHDRAARSQQEDKAEYDMGENGAPINRDERSALDALMQTIRFEKKRR